MILLLRLYKLFLNIFYFLIKLLPLKTNKNRILFLSRQGSNLSIDFKYIIEDIKKRYPHVEVCVLSKRMVKTNILHIISYVFHPFVQLLYLRTSKVCVIDGYHMAISNVKHREDLKIIQLWHSMGAIKKFGYQTLKKPRDIKEAKVMNMHKNYDVIVSSSKEMTKYFAKAFNYPETSFVHYNLPRVEYLLKTKDSNRKKVYKMYPSLKNKKVVLYVPTFRKYGEYKIDEIIEAFKGSKYTLIIKKHLRMNVNVPDEYSYDKVSSLELLSIADYVITDYSAISLEAAILNKPVLLYVYDYEMYDEVEGINTDMDKDLPGYVFKDINLLVESINKNKYDLNVLRKYKEKYITESEINATERLVDYIVGEL